MVRRRTERNTREGSQALAPRGTGPRTAGGESGRSPPAPGAFVVAIPLRIVIVVVQVAKWRARRHPDIEPTEIGLPIPAGNEQQRATVERPVGVKLGELGVHRRS